MLSKCVQCSFYIRRNEEFCPNCGSVDSFDDLSLWKKHYFTFLLIGFSTAILTLVISFTTHRLQDEIIPIILLSFGISVFFGVIYEFNREFRKDDENRRRFFNKSLKHKAKTIDKRIEELINRKNKISSVLYQIGTEPSTTLLPVREKLLSAHEILENQSARYSLKQENIKLVRLQNKILPYLLYLDRLDETITKEGIFNSDNTMREIGKLRESLSNNFPRKVEAERVEFLKNLDETSQSCEKLWEALLSKQALFALKDVQPTNEIGQILHAEELAHATETFNLQAKLTDFSESFDELEAEYKRLTADDEITQKFLTE
jgi:hypothetical protein